MNRKNTYIIERYQAIGSYLGVLLMLLSAVLAFPILVTIFYPDQIGFVAPFLISAAILAGTGLILRLISRQHQGLNLLPLNFNESSIVVALTWVCASIAGAIPYMMLSGMNFSQAMFDSVSGWTTTGLSLLDIPHAQVIVLFYRGWAQFVGGAGFAVIMLSSLTGVGAQHLYSAEGKGTLIKPNVLASAKIVVSLYFGYFVVGSILYMICGMRLFDAIVYCFAAISTGGFGNQMQNIGYYNSPSIEFVSMILMILGNLSFLTGYFIVKGKIKSIYRNGEVRVMTLSLLLAIPLVFLFVTSHIFASTTKAIRVAAFETVSAITTTGFFTVDYNRPLWFDSGIFILILLQLIGGGTCSTAGGIKQYRVYIMYKTVLWHIKAAILPNKAVIKNYIWEGELKGYINDGRIKEIASFIFAYLAIYIVGVSVIAFSVNPASGSPYPIRDAMFEFASALGTVGLSIGLSTAHTPPHVIWTETIGMFLGRLEIFVVILAIMKLLKDSAGMLRSAFQK